MQSQAVLNWRVVEVSTQDTSILFYLSESLLKTAKEFKVPTYPVKKLDPSDPSRSAAAAAPPFVARERNVERAHAHTAKTTNHGPLYKDFSCGSGGSKNKNARKLFS